MNTEQIEFWQGSFGKEYTDRNTFSVEQLDQIYKEQYGVTRTEMNEQFVGQLAECRTLEVGCNVGNILLHLQSIGFNDLYGVELQPYAVEKAKERTNHINVLQGSAFDLPFKDRYFPLVYTSGVLIHLSPDHIAMVMDEMYRVSNRYIWGFEYYSDHYEEINYHGQSGKMWKSDFVSLFVSRYPDLQIVKETKYKYVKNDNVDQMYLLEKRIE
ncbi:pseudaminic acid biosynthesis-associated methylase [Paenibacillus abyssi]|uniref:Methyltransferase type 11 domain-containing protein n=1 Tax=Paenibacillus abyssi TaxID=1340531 RepID=A0A917CLR0_9BACL|nr:pseudaminic acid biosynthesis-associated methylase [Paenibacillus abyssi]GGF91475.1 hypothetical protein GCM10010916_05960 [Paenibacillus abyssi]